MADPLTPEQLDDIERRCVAASPSPWESFVEGRDHTSGSDFIRVGGDGSDEPDMYLLRGEGGASAQDQDFVAHARQDVPRLLAEVRRLRALLDQDSG
jgi:hypothetical protein